MNERDRLAASGEIAQAQTELDRQATAQAQAERAADGLGSKNFFEYDAEQGTVSLIDSRGGIAAVSSQGTLSNAAIAKGQPTSPYGWRVADWSPAIIVPRLIVPTDFSAQPGTGTGTGDGADDGTGTGTGSECTAQILCYRGEPYEDPAENEPPDPGSGTCNDIYAIRWTWVYRGRFGSSVSQDSVGSGYPPFYVYIAQRGVPHQFIPNYTPSQDEAGLVTHDANGNLVPPNGYSRPGSTRSNGQQGWIRFNRGSATAYPVRYASGPPAGWTPAPGATYANTLGVNVSQGNEYYVGPGSPPDNCSDFGTPPPAYGPPIGSDPAQWRSVLSNNPPINYTADTNGDRTLITVTDATGELVRLDFLPGQYEIKIACKEDGCES